MEKVLEIFSPAIQELIAQHPFILYVVLLPLAWLASWRLVYVMKERSLSFNDKRLAWLMEVLATENPHKMHPLRLELVFRRAYEYRYNSEEILLALSKTNTSTFLFNLRYGGSFVKWNNKTGLFETIRPRKLSFKAREKWADGIAQIVLVPLIVFSFIYIFIDPVMGGIFLVELSACFWLMLNISRGLACTQLLISEQEKNATEIQTTQLVTCKYIEVAQETNALTERIG